ncbi:MAG: phasin family protein [Gammaproteobacteria bacterium]
MDNPFMDNWQEYSKSAVSAAKELETINTQIIEKMTGKQMELANVAFETGTRYMSSLSEVKGYQELVSEHAKLAADFNEKMMEAARSAADIMTESRDLYQAWMEKNMKAVTGGVEFTMPGFPAAKKPAAKKAA